MRLRECQRYCCAWPGDHYLKARMLRHLVRSGDISIHHIRLGAFLGHEACKLIVKEDVKSTGVCVGGTIIKNIEINSYIDGLRYWNLEVVYRAALGICKLINSQIQNKKNKVSSDTDKLVDRLEIYIDDLEDNKKLQRLNAMLTGREFYISRYNTRHGNIQSCLGLMVGQILRRRNCTNHMRSAAVYYDDKWIKRAIRSEVYPFIFGEYL